MKQNKVALKTLAIKARVYNQIRTDLYKKRLDKITEKEKIAFFDKIFELNREAHNELNAYKAKRQYKEKIHQDRIKRGYKFKKKNPKKDLESPK